MPTPAPASPGLRLLAGLALGQLVSWGTTYYLPAVVLEAVRADLGLSRSASSGAYAVGLLVSGLAAVPVGLLVDRGRHRVVLVAGSALCVLGLLLHAAVTTTWQLYAVWVLLGVGMASTLYEPVFALLIRQYPGAYRRNITFVTLAGGLASTVFWPLSAWLVSALGWRGALVTLAGVTAVFGPLLYLLVLPPSGPASPVAHGARVPTHTLIRSRVFLCLAVAFVLQSIVISGLSAHVLTLFAAFGAAGGVALTAAASIGAMQVVGRVLLLALESRAGAARTATVVIWLLPVAVAALPGVGLLPWLPFAFALLYGTGNGMMTIVKGTAAADLISREHVATLNGALALPNAFARASGPLVVASVWDATHLPAAPVGLMLGLATVAAVALQLAVRFAKRGG
jgi:MFS family permease